MSAKGSATASAVAAASSAALRRVFPSVRTPVSSSTFAPTASSPAAPTSRLGTTCSGSHNVSTDRKLFFTGNSCRVGYTSRMSRNRFAAATWSSSPNTSPATIHFYISFFDVPPLAVTAPTGTPNSSRLFSIFSMFFQNNKPLPPTYSCSLVAKVSVATFLATILCAHPQRASRDKSVPLHSRTHAPFVIAPLHFISLFRTCTGSQVD